MKKILINSATIFALTISIGCNQSQDKRQEQVQSTLPTSEPAPIPKEEPVQKKSSAKFNYVSEVSFYNNKSNSYSHFYSVYVENFNDKDENVWADMSTEALTKPYSKNGFTTLLFFNSKKNTPILVEGKGLDFDTKYDKYCVGGYWHYPNGEQEMKRYPMK